MPPFQLFFSATHSCCPSPGADTPLDGLKPARFSPTPFGLLASWANSPVVARWSAQALAPAARSTLHTSGGTPTAARSLLCTARILLAKSAVFSVLLLPVDVVGKVALLSVVVVVDPPADEPLLSVVVDEPPPVDDEPLLSVVVPPPPVDDEPLLSVVVPPPVDESSPLSVD